MAPVWAAHVFGEVAELLAERDEHLIFVLDRLYKHTGRSAATGDDRARGGGVTDRRGTGSALRECVLRQEPAQWWKGGGWR